MNKQIFDVFGDILKAAVAQLSGDERERLSLQLGAGSGQSLDNPSLINEFSVRRALLSWGKTFDKYGLSREWAQLVAIVDRNNAQSIATAILFTLLSTPRLYNQAQVAGILGVSKAAITGRIERGTMPEPAETIAGKSYWNGKQVQELIDKQI